MTRSPTPYNATRRVKTNTPSPPPPPLPYTITHMKKPHTASVGGKKIKKVVKKLSKDVVIKPNRVI